MQCFICSVRSFVTVAGRTRASTRCRPVTADPHYARAVTRGGATLTSLSAGRKMRLSAGESTPNLPDPAPVLESASFSIPIR